VWVTSQPADFHVSFVCSGNICRSPMAALVFGEHLRRAGLDDRVRVSSAGVGAWHVGEPADARARQTLAAHGYPTEHVAALVDDDHLAADLVLAMDSGHEAILRRTVDTRDRVRMFRSFDPAAADDLDVPDPYYGDLAGYAVVLDMIEAATPGLLAHVRQRLAA
jgi:protein-tyrosine phosphatase